MVYVIRKVDKKTYQVRNKFSGVVKAVRPSYAEAQRVANDLNRDQQQALSGRNRQTFYGMQEAK